MQTFSLEQHSNVNAACPETWCDLTKWHVNCLYDWICSAYSVARSSLCIFSTPLWLVCEALALYHDRFSFAKRYSPRKVEHILGGKHLINWLTHVHCLTLLVIWTNILTQLWLIRKRAWRRIGFNPSCRSGQTIFNKLVKCPRWARHNQIPLTWQTCLIPHQTHCSVPLTQVSDNNSGVFQQEKLYRRGHKRKNICKGDDTLIKGKALMKGAAFTRITVDAYIKNRTFPAQGRYFWKRLKVEKVDTRVDRKDFQGWGVYWKRNQLNERDLGRDGLSLFRTRRICLCKSIHSSLQREAPLGALNAVLRSKENYKNNQTHIEQGHSFESFMHIKPLDVASLFSTFRTSSPFYTPQLALQEVVSWSQGGLTNGPRKYLHGSKLAGNVFEESRIFDI